MSKQTVNQVLQSKNVTEFTKIMSTKTNQFYGISPTSASLPTINVVNGTYNVFSGSYNGGVFNSVYTTAGSSSLDIAETLGLIDIRLNPQLYKKYQLNYALSTGSSYNEAVMWADRNS